MAMLKWEAGAHVFELYTPSDFLLLNFRRMHFSLSFVCQGLSKCTTISL